MSDPTPYNPLDKVNLGKSVADALLLRPKVPLGELKQFNGVGIYAIYYNGELEAYVQLTQLARLYQVEIPIYVGKADLEGKRKGLILSSVESSRSLYKRLADHISSINSATNLDIAEFYCRYLVVDEIWIPLGESLLIARFAPLWNQIVDGFGNHDPGAGRHKGVRSRWDVLHPGRKWNENLQPRLETPMQIIDDINEHVRSSPVIQKLVAGLFPKSDVDLDKGEE